MEFLYFESENNKENQSKESTGLRPRRSQMGRTPLGQITHMTGVTGKKPQLLKKKSSIMSKNDSKGMSQIKSMRC